MKPLLKSKTIALTLALLIISMPIAFAQQINYITDANGNLVGGDNYYREYNEFNQLIKIRQGNSSTDPLLQEYFWHPVEERILEKRTYLPNGALKERILYINENYLIIENQSGRYNETYVYQDGVLVAQIDTNGNKQAMHSDHEGSSSLVTDSNGNLVEISFYSPYGEILEGGKASRFDYEGKEFDSAVQDYDFHFRKYNPSLPLFHQPDTLIQNVYDPQALNRYAFERNNPYLHVDPDGHILPLLAVLGVISAVSVVIGGIVLINKVLNDEATTEDRVLFYGGVAVKGIGKGKKVVEGMKTTEDVGGLTLDGSYIVQDTMKGGKGGNSPGNSQSFKTETTISGSGREVTVRTPTQTSNDSFGAAWRKKMADFWKKVISDRKEKEKKEKEKAEKKKEEKKSNKNT